MSAHHLSGLFVHRLGRMLAAAVVILAASGCGKEATVPAKSPSESLPVENVTAEQAQLLLQLGKPDEALQMAQRIMIDDPNNVEALTVIAKVLASKSRFAEAADVALQLADLIKSDPVTQLLYAFEWHMRAGDPISAEGDLLRAIKLAPNDARGHRTLAQLLNAQGRRSESLEHLIALERLGGMEHLEAMSLIDLGEPFRLVDFGELIEPMSNSLFELGKARLTYAANKNAKLALEMVDRLTGTDADVAAVKAFRGRLIAEGTVDSRLDDWFKSLPPDIQKQPEYWFMIGEWFARQQQDREALRAFGEAIRLDPTDRRSLTSIAVLLDRLGEHDRANRVKESLATLNTIVRQAKDADVEKSMWIAEHLQGLVRPWESIAWYRHAIELQGQLEQRRSELELRRTQIRAWEQKGSVDQIRDARLKALLGFDVSEFPMPDLAKRTTVPTAQEATTNSPLRFHDVAASMNVMTSFVSDYPESGVDFFLHQTNGGGIAVLDFDLNGLSDLYFVQSGGDPQEPNDSTPNQLYQHLPNGKFTEVSTESQTADKGFGQGACAADINQDGFPDLLIANIGKNSLYMNQGDGTFSLQSTWIGGNESRWTSSIAVGDLDGDSLPDLVEVNYVDDATVFERRCRGVESYCAPQRFRAAKDRLLKNMGDGRLQPWEEVPESSVQPNYGFGAVIANFDGLAGNDVFISNDGDVNHYWKSKLNPTGTSKSYQLQELASLSGCSVGRSGYAQACMGIASGDFDQNGFLDLFVTNFHNEPVNLFLQNTSGFFTDEAGRYGLVEPSMSVLGFGTQAADFDNDGWLDVAVLNGHIYNATQLGVPFKMRAQLFHGGKGEFQNQDPAVAGPYWQREQLGRTLALFDVNRDGRMDLVANHLDQPVAILENDSESQQWLQLELVGVSSERSAIGARVTVSAGDRKWTGWRSGGDGYMCTNEAVVHFGLGDASKLDSIEISWPAGETQSFTSIESNRRYLAVEGLQTLYPR